MSPPKISTPASEDRISSLSDEIISHILSFIPTKHAVTTSILSKRWNHLWHFIPLLNFTDINFEDRESILQFNQFVYSVLLSRNTSGFHSINAFFLHIQYTNPNHLKLLSIPNLTTWINHVVQRNVKHLHLLLHSLHNLDHDDDDVDNDLDDDDDDRNYIPKLPISIFSCKILVVLKLNWFSVQDFSFSSVGFEFPSLKTLHLSYIDFDEDRELMWLLSGCPVLEDFKASNVFVYFERRDRRNCKEFQNLNLSKLIQADVIHCMCYFPMKALFNSEFLRLQLREMYIPYDFPTFHNLTHLVINNDWEFVVQVLHHCPKLQNLDLHQKIRNNWVEPEFAPQCISLCLRTCTIREFRFACLQHYIMLPKYILQNAGVLQTMTIWSDMEQHEIERELSSCPRASATCQLSVY